MSFWQNDIIAFCARWGGTHYLGQWIGSFIGSGHDLIIAWKPLSHYLNQYWITVRIGRYWNQEAVRLVIRDFALSWNLTCLTDGSATSPPFIQQYRRRIRFIHKYQYHGSESSRDLSILSPRLGTQNLYGTKECYEIFTPICVKSQEFRRTSVVLSLGAQIYVSNFYHRT